MFVLLTPSISTASTSRRPIADEEWKSRLRAVDLLLRDGDWAAADQEAAEILDDLKRRLLTGGHNIVAVAALQRAVALSGRGQERSARLYADIARIFWPRSLQLLDGFGDQGRHLASSLAEPRRRPQIVVDDGYGRIVLYSGDLTPRSGLALRTPDEPFGLHDDRIEPPRRVSGSDPDYPYGFRIREISTTIVVETEIDEAGYVRLIDLGEPNPYTPLVLDTLELIGRWRFEPATLDGAPVSVYHAITVWFSIGP